MRVYVLAALCVVLLALPATAEKSSSTTWVVPNDFSTIQDAIDDPDVVDGDTIEVKSGSHAGALIDKKVTIKGVGTAVIDEGPAHGSGLIQGFRLLAGSDGTEIDHLEFEVDLAIMNGGAVDDVEVHHCSFDNAVQAISNWRGWGWEIHHNKITDLRTLCGGGIGVLIGDYSGGDVKDNYVHHNTITGTLHVDEEDCGGYNGSGIVLYADFRWGGAGAEEISGNTISHNKVSMESDTPEVVDIAAFELTDSRDDDSNDPVIYDNVVEHNDFRDTSIGIALTPTGLEDVNEFSKNKVDDE